MLCRKIDTNVTFRLRFLLEQTKDCTEDAMKSRISEHPDEIVSMDYRMTKIDERDQTVTFRVLAQQRVGMSAECEEMAKESILANL